MSTVPAVAPPVEPTASAEGAPRCDQSTLIYTLAPDCTALSWDEFSLIVRSLHSYKIINIKEEKPAGTISVTVGYFANTANARRRLGNAAEYIGVSRLSSSVRIGELQTLQQLRSKFGFGGPIDEEEPAPSGKNSRNPKRKKYAYYN